MMVEVTERSCILPRSARFRSRGSGSSVWENLARIFRAFQASQSASEDTLIVRSQMSMKLVIQFKQMHHDCDARHMAWI